MDTVGVIEDQNEKDNGDDDGINDDDDTSSLGGCDDARVVVVVEVGTLLFLFDGNSLVGKLG